MKSIKVKEIVSAVNGRLLCGDKNQIITSVSTNSKEIKKGALFIPIKGEKVDPHCFIESALENGAAAVFTNREHGVSELEKSNGKAYIQVKDTLKALQDFACYYRNCFQIPVIGITGSVGKTTTKEMVSAALETKYNVLKTAGNKNSQVGVPLTIFGLEEEHEAAVIEMGISEEGEMHKLARMVRPDFAVITNIGVSHIAQLKSRENICKEKMCIIDYSSSKLFINGDDNLLSEIKMFKKASQNSCNIVLNSETEESLGKLDVLSYGTGKECDYRAENIVLKKGRTYFDMICKGETVHMEIAAAGQHNVQNALAAAAVAEAFNISPAMAAEGLKKYSPPAMRGQIYEKDGIQIIDDTYNASPDSMKSGIGVLLSLENRKRRFAVLADVLELGEMSCKLHYEIGEYIAKTALEELVTIGQEAEAIAAAVKEENENITVHSYLSNSEAVTYLKQAVKPGDAVLIKGSRGMHTDEIVGSLMRQ